MHTYPGEQEWPKSRQRMQCEVSEAGQGLQCENFEAPSEDDEDHDLLFGREDDGFADSAPELGAPNHVATIGCTKQFEIIMMLKCGW